MAVLETYEILAFFVLAPVTGAYAMVAFSVDNRPARAGRLALAGLLAMLAVTGAAGA